MPEGVGGRGTPISVSVPADRGVLLAMPVPPAIRNLVPMLHVADVRRAAAFYARLGFAVAHTHSEPDDAAGTTVWAWLRSAGGADLMLARVDEPFDRQHPGEVLHL